MFEAFSCCESLLPATPEISSTSVTDLCKLLGSETAHGRTRSSGMSKLHLAKKVSPPRHIGVPSHARLRRRIRHKKSPCFPNRPALGGL